jgi:hypothetical protein
VDEERLSETKIFFKEVVCFETSDFVGDSVLSENFSWDEFWMRSSHVET